MSKISINNVSNNKKEREITHNFYIMDDIVYFSLKGRAVDYDVLASVSSNKWHLVSKYNWYLGKAGYPVCYELGMMQLHRFIYTDIFGQIIPSNLYVDHIDHNKLNNIDSNLRLATPQENSFNKSTASNKKGVKKISENNYTATIMKDGNKHEIKNIKTSEQAAEIYNMMAEELFGIFASPNKIG